jgi:thioredoxin 1
MSEPIHVDDNTFEAAVLQSALPVLVDFWAPWCGPCRMVSTHVDKIAQEYDGRLTVAKVNTDDNTKWAAQYRVTGLPTLLFMINGQVINQQVGGVSHAALKQMVDQLLAQAGSSDNAAR